MEDKKLEPGDVVVLKSGGPPMTIGQFTGDRRTAECYWFLDSHVQTHWFKIESLKFNQSTDAYRTSAKEH